MLQNAAGISFLVFPVFDPAFFTAKPHSLSKDRSYSCAFTKWALASFICYLVSEETRVGKEGESRRNVCTPTRKGAQEAILKMQSSRINKEQAQRQTPQSDRPANRLLLSEVLGTEQLAYEGKHVPGSSV